MSNKQKHNTQNLGSPSSGPKASKRSVKNKNRKGPVPSAGPNRPTPARNDRKLTSRAPRQTSLKNGGTRIEMEEMVGPIRKPVTPDVPVTTDVLLKIMRLRMNPGSKKSFNWLSTIAVNYEHYKFLKLEFHYLTRVGTTKEGSLIMSPDYDAEDGDQAVTEQTLFSNKGTTDESLYKNHAVILSPAAMNRQFKSHSVMSDERFDTTDQDTKTVDAAQLHICLDVADTAAMKFGKLIVKYIVELTDPQNPTEPTNKGGFAFNRVGGLAVNSTKPILTIVPIGSNIISDRGVINPAAAIPSLTYPTAVIGQFIKDYTGTLSTRTNGTNISGTNKFYVSKESGMNTAAGSPGETLLPGNSLMDLYGNVDANSYTVDIVAKAGDLLKVSSGLADTFDRLRIIAGGVLNSDLL